MPSTLDALIAAAPAVERRTVNVDLADLLGVEPGEATFTLREPSLADLFIAQSDAEKIRSKHSGWPALMCQTIAMLALSHAAPPAAGRPVGLVYCDLAERFPAAVMRLAAAFGAAFPAIGDLEAAGAAAKND